MKKIITYLTESNSKFSTGDLKYAMTYKSFKTWINTCDKNDSFVTYVLVDTDTAMEDLDSTQFAETVYSEELNDWVAVGDSGDLKVSEWTLAADDLVLIF